MKCVLFGSQHPTRLMFAWKLAEVVGQELVREELIGHFVQLLKDNEAEVRTAAAGQIPGMATRCP